VTSRLQEKGYCTRPPLILTTNFDDWMERALLAAGEACHLFTFRVEEPYAGHFVYQSPSGEVLVVDRPEQFHEIPGEHAIVVKYHGGLHHDIPLSITYAFTQGDFMQATRRLPAALPRAVLDRLTGSSLLFLGHGLADDSVEALVRELHRRNPRMRSWAIQRTPRPGWPLYWREIGVDIVDILLESFVLKMHQQLEELPAIGLTE
jgi:SIR2-like domain